MAVWVSDGELPGCGGGRGSSGDKEQDPAALPTCCMVGVGSGEGASRDQEEKAGSYWVSSKGARHRGKGAGRPRMRSGGLDYKRPQVFSCVCLSDIRCQTLKGPGGAGGLPFVYTPTTSQAWDGTMHHLFFLIIKPFLWK